MDPDEEKYIRKMSSAKCENDDLNVSDSEDVGNLHQKPLSTDSENSSSPKSSNEQSKRNQNVNSNNNVINQNAVAADPLRTTSFSVSDILDPRKFTGSQNPTKSNVWKPWNERRKRSSDSEDSSSDRDRMEIPGMNSWILEENIENASGEFVQFFFVIENNHFCFLQNNNLK